jgi:hypothetical protein
MQAPPGFQIRHVEADGNCFYHCMRVWWLRYKFLLPRCTVRLADTRAILDVMRQGVAEQYSFLEPDAMLTHHYAAVKDKENAPEGEVSAGPPVCPSVSTA